MPTSRREEHSINHVSHAIGAQDVRLDNCGTTLASAHSHSTCSGVDQYAHGCSIDCSDFHVVGEFIAPPLATSDMVRKDACEPHRVREK